MDLVEKYQPDVDEFSLSNLTKTNFLQNFLVDKLEEALYTDSRFGCFLGGRLDQFQSNWEMLVDFD